MAIEVVLCLLDLSPRDASTFPLYPRGRGYKEGNQVSYNMISIRTLSPLAYFTYIFIDIIIYAFESMPRSSIIFCMLGRVVSDPSMSLLSPCGVVPRVPILVNRPLRISHPRPYCGGRASASSHRPTAKLNRGM
jgi:hypothetical protein